MSCQRTKAIVCHQENEDKFTFSFRLECSQPINVKREFNMCRNINEDMTAFTHRLTENITKKLEKKTKKAKLEQSSENIFENAIGFKVNDQIVNPESSELKAKDFLAQNGLTLQIFSSIFDIDINPPLIQDVKLPETIMSGFPVYPLKLAMLFAREESSIFKWFVS